MLPGKKKIVKLNDELFGGGLFDDLPVHPSIEEAAEACAREQALGACPADGLDPMETRTPRKSLCFISFGSGSSGNSSYIGTKEAGVIIDIGVDYKYVVETLARNGISMNAVKGILVTHDHGDHIRYIYSLVRNYKHINVFCTPRCFNGIMRRHNISRRLKDYHKVIYKEFPFQLAGLEITAFEVSHDGSDNSGFFIKTVDDANLRFAIATDLGCITDRVDHYMRQAQFVVIESNYDAHMLDIGPYPSYLKGRIAAANGHLDNVATARFITSIMSPQLTHVFLCHLSRDNNTPSIALSTMKSELAQIGIDRVGQALETPADRDARLQLVALPRHDASPLYYLY